MQNEKETSQNTKIDEKLKKYIENIEKLSEEKKEISQLITDVYKEAKAVGFDTKIMRKIIRLRKLDLDEQTEIKGLMETYCEALGMPIQMNLF